MNIKMMAVFLACSAVIGCQQVGQVASGLDYSTGVNVTASQMDSLANNKSTKVDVVKMLGEPGSKREFNGVEIWNYGYTFIPATPFSGKKNVSETTIFEFNNEGVLLNHYKTNASKQTGNALLDAAGM